MKAITAHLYQLAPQLLDKRSRRRFFLEIEKELIVRTWIDCDVMRWNPAIFTKALLSFPACHFCYLTCYRQITPIIQKCSCSYYIYMSTQFYIHNCDVLVFVPAMLNDVWSAVAFFHQQSSFSWKVLTHVMSCAFVPYTARCTEEWVEGNHLVLLPRRS